VVEFFHEKPNSRSSAAAFLRRYTRQRYDATAFRDSQMLFVEDDVPVPPIVTPSNSTSTIVGQRLNC